MAREAVAQSALLRYYLCFEGQGVVSKSSHFANTQR